MKNKKIIIILLFNLMLIILGGRVFADNQLEAISVLSQEYLDWTKLPDEEKNSTIQPFPIDIEYNKSSGNVLASRSRMKVSGKSNLLPSTYDLREHINIEVKNQGSTNSCWAYSSNSTIETYLELNNEETWDFSERHLEYSTASNFKDGQNIGSLDRKIGSGGNSYIAFAYYARGDGPILEESMPFENNENEISINDLPNADSVKHIEGMKNFPTIKKEYNTNNEIVYKNANGQIYNAEDLKTLRNEIKEHIIKYGGVSTIIYYNDQYYNVEKASYNMNVSGFSVNHVVTIIGWDDNYSADNFIRKPSSNGAYIVLNSWGKQWGNNGVFYVSYEDILIERYLSGITEVSDIDYNKIYQHDMSVMTAYFNIKYCANVYTSEQDEKLTEIVIGMPSNQKCNIYVNPNGDNLDINEIIKVKNNMAVYSGYNTIKLENPIELKKDNKFAIIVEIIDFDGKSVGIESSISYPSVTSNQGESFASVNGEEWEDIYSEDSSERNFIIKALTQFEEEFEDLNGKIYNDGTGEISLTISKEKIENEANLDISIIYSHTGEDLTDSYKITESTILGKGKNLKIEPLLKVKGGKYILKIESSGLEIINKEFIVTNETEPIIEIIQNPVKMLYFLGEDMDLTGGTIIKINTDETIQEIEMTNENVKLFDFDSDEEAEIAVTIKYNDLIAYLGPVVVLTEEHAIYNINIEKLPKKLTYIKGENLKSEGLEVKATYLVVYSDGDYRVALNEEEYENSKYKFERIEELSNEKLQISEFNSDELGSKEITVSYKGKVAKFNVTVRNEIARIEIKNAPDNTIYIKGEELDLTGGKINLVYENGEKEELDMTSNEIEIEGFDPTSIGKKLITTRFNGYEAQFFIQIYENEIESEIYEIEDQSISNIDANTDILSFKENMKFYKKDYRIFEGNEDVTETATLIKTGQKLVINNKEYELVVPGDISGDGQIKGSDLSKIKSALIGKIELTGAYLKAADFNNDGVIKASDMSRLKSMLIGK